MSLLWLGISEHCRSLSINGDGGDNGMGAAWAISVSAGGGGVLLLARSMPYRLVNQRGARAHWNGQPLTFSSCRSICLALLRLLL